MILNMMVLLKKEIEDSGIIRIILPKHFVYFIQNLY